MHQRIAAALAIVLLCSWSAGVLGRQGPAPPAAGAAQKPSAIVDDAALVAAEERTGEWITYGRTQDEQRHSPLTKITDRNVGELKLAWTFDTRHRSRARGDTAGR